MEDDGKIKALISLVEDPDESVFEHVRERLLEFGPEVISLLENSWMERDLGDQFRERIANIIGEIQLEEVKRRVVVWYDSPQKDLLEGAIIVAKYQYPNLDEDKIRQAIERLRRDCWLELNDYMTAFEKIQVLNKVIFGVHHFTGNKENYSSPLNSYINTVIETKKGNPLSLCILYSVVASQLNLPIFGVNLPNHFILAYIDQNGTNNFLSNANEYGVLFYINAFSKGTIFQKEDITQFLSGINQQPQTWHYEPCSNSDIIRRMLTNLIAAYQQNGEEKKVEDLIELRNFLDD
jgi:regulator of sirC expression with transglutaminase-like and TPR domain